MMSDFSEEAYVYLEPNQRSPSQEISGPKIGVDNIGYENETDGIQPHSDDKEDDSGTHDDNGTPSGDVTTISVLEE